MGDKRASRRRFLATVAGVAAAGTSGCGSDGGTTPTAADVTGDETPTPGPGDFAEWPSYLRNEQNWGHHPDARGPDGEVSVAWKRDLAASEVNATPVLANGTLYVGDGEVDGDSGHFYALNPLTGETKWSKSFNGAVLGSAAGGGYVFVSGGGNVAVYQEDGTELWRWNSRLGGPFTPPTLGEDGIYFGTPSGNAFRFARRSKVRKWQLDLFGEVSSPPVLDENRVYFPTRSGTISARKRSRGKVWTANLGSPLNGLSMRDRRLYASLDSGAVVKLDRSGNRLWRGSPPGSPNASPAVTEDRLFVGTSDNAVVALNVDSGFQEWKFTVPNRRFTAPAVVADGTVYIGNRNNSVYAIDAETGEKEWSFSTDGSIVVPSVIVAGGMVFVGTKTGSFYALSD